jgi:hypothetical protein
MITKRHFLIEPKISKKFKILLSFFDSKNRFDQFLLKQYKDLEFIEHNKFISSTADHFIPALNNGMSPQKYYRRQTIKNKVCLPA